jgi:hypothetical protein
MPGPYDVTSRLFMLGVIDILTTFDLTKRAERFLKSFVYDSRGISSMNPQDYGKRFLDFLTSIVFREQQQP